MRSQTPLWKSFAFALVGVGHVVRRQRNFRLQLAMAAAVVALGVWLGLPLRDWAVLSLTIALVFAAEMINTVTEAVVDLITQERREPARIVKDVAAGTVLVLAAGSVVVGLLILGPPLWERLAL